MLESKDFAAAVQAAWIKASEEFNAAPDQRKYDTAARLHSLLQDGHARRLIREAINNG